MALNIKNDEVHQLATELARRRGVSVTQAVREAVSHELERDRRRNPKTNLAEELLAIGRRCAEHIARPAASADHAALLYNDQGLPR